MSLDIQMQIRNQANETRQSLIEVKSWEEKIDQRDRELIELAKQGKHGYDQPTNTKRAGQDKDNSKPKGPKKVEIQKDNGNESKEKTVKQGVQQKTPGKGSAARSYEEWQKIDSMLKKKEEEGVDDDDEEKPKLTAEQHKENGNKFYKAKKYELAIREYTAAINLDSSNAVYYYNRATAFWSSGNNEAAERDATEAIKYDPRYVKAYMRRALAREARGDDYGALKDLEQIQDKAQEIRQIGDKLVEVRARLGISPDGAVREVREPKVQVTKEEKPVSKPKIEIVEEKTIEPPRTDVLEPMPQQERHTPVVVEEESVTLNPMITQPQKVQIIEEEPAKPKKVPIITEEPAKPKKVPIVTEEPVKPKKVPIVTEEPAKPKKVPIVTEEPAKPKKVAVIEEEEPEKPKTTAENTKENEDAMKEALSQLDGTAEKEVPKKKKESKANKPKKTGKAKKAAAAINVSWSDVPDNQVPGILAKMDPSTLNRSLGTILDAEIITKIIKSIGDLPPVKAFAFCLELSRNDNFEYLIFDDAVTALRDDVKKAIDAYEKVEGADPRLARECKNKWL